MRSGCRFCELGQCFSLSLSLSLSEIETNSGSDFGSQRLTARFVKGAKSEKKEERKRRKKRETTMNESGLFIGFRRCVFILKGKVKGLG